MAEGDRGDHHPSPAEWERFLLGAMSPRQAAPLIAHLVHGCEPCRQRMATLATVVLSGGQAVPAEPETGDGSQYDFPLFKALAGARRYAQTLAAKGDEARRSPALREVPLPPPAWLARDRDRCEALLERAWSLRFSDPEGMVLAAELAVNLAERLDLGGPDAAELVDIQARAWGELGNARRVSDDLAEAEAALARALERAGQGSGDPRLLARLMDLTASLYIDQRRFDEAHRLLDLVHDTYLRIGDTHLAGRALISKGMASSYEFKIEEVVRLLGRGLALLEGGRDPKLTMVAVHNLIWYLVESGDADQADLLFRQSRSLYANCAQRLELVKAGWLEGRIAAAIGDGELAERRFLEARARFEEARLPYDVAIVTLDLAALWLRAGRTAEVREIVQETIAVFQARAIHREALGTLLMLREALQRDQATEALLRTVALELLRLEDATPRKSRSGD